MITIKQQEARRHYWGPLSSADYLWGSLIQGFARDKVVFKNPLMPSGQILKTWKSMSNFSDNRLAPSLPLLKRGQSYVLDVSMTSTPSHTVMVEIVFQDRVGVAVKRQVASDGSLAFVYPENAYAYEVHLLSAGMQEFVFHYFTITPNSSEGAEVLA